MTTAMLLQQTGQHITVRPDNRAYPCRVMLEFLADVRGEEAGTICKAAYNNAKQVFKGH